MIQRLLQPLKLLWLIDITRYELTEPLEGSTLRPGTYEKAIAIPAPGFVIPPVLFAVGIAFYAAAFYVAVQGVMGRGAWNAVLPSAVLMAFSGMLRGSMKWRERAAAQVEWTTPVARERTITRVLMGTWGAATGAAAGWLLFQRVPGLDQRTPEHLVMAILAAGELLRNVTRLRGGWSYTEFDVNEHTKYYRVLKAGELAGAKR